MQWSLHSAKKFFKKIKNTLCRVPVLWHSAKRLKKADFFAECRSCGTRQRVFFKKKLDSVGRRPTASNICRVPARHSAKPLPSARNLALGKAAFTGRGFDGGSLPSVALGKGFAVCKAAFAECNKHSAKSLPPVVHVW